jgi:hypothetical protein
MVLEEGSYGFLSGWYFLLRVRYARLISFSDACLSIPRSLERLALVMQLWRVIEKRKDCILCRSPLCRPQAVTGTVAPTMLRGTTCLLRACDALTHKRLPKSNASCNGLPNSKKNNHEKH